MRPDDATLLDWAGRAGHAALPAFFVLLAATLGAMVLLDRAWRHQRLQRWRGALPAPALLGAALAAGFVLVLGAGLAFAELAEAVLESGRLARLDQAFSAGVQAGTPALAVHAFALVTRLGDTATLTVLCIGVALALLRTGGRVLAFAWVGAVAGNALLNSSLKAVFVRTRPPHADSPVQAEGWSFPSGHSSGSLVAYGMLAYLALRLAPPRWHLPAMLAAAALALSVAASRVFLRVHYASDVLAGLASGSAWLLVCIGAAEVARRARTS